MAARSERLAGRKPKATVKELTPTGRRKIVSAIKKMETEVEEMRTQIRDLKTITKYFSFWIIG
jgi:hypothetical protein